MLIGAECGGGSVRVVLSRHRPVVVVFLRCPLPPGTVSRNASPTEGRGCASIGAVWWGERVCGRPTGVLPWCASFPTAFPVPRFSFLIPAIRGFVLGSHAEFLLGHRRMFGLSTHQSDQLSRGEETSGRLLPVVCRRDLPPLFARRRTFHASWASAGVTIWKAWVARSEPGLR